MCLSFCVTYTFLNNSLWKLLNSWKFFSSFFAVRHFSGKRYFILHLNYAVCINQHLILKWNTSAVTQDMLDNYRVPSLLLKIQSFTIKRQTFGPCSSQASLSVVCFELFGWNRKLALLHWHEVTPLGLVCPQQGFWWTEQWHRKNGINMQYNTWWISLASFELYVHQNWIWHSTKLLQCRVQVCQLEVRL